MQGIFLKIRFDFPVLQQRFSSQETKILLGFPMGKGFNKKDHAAIEATRGNTSPTWETSVTVHPFHSGRTKKGRTVAIKHLQFRGPFVSYSICSYFNLFRSLE